MVQQHSNFHHYIIDTARVATEPVVATRNSCPMQRESGAELGMSLTPATCQIK